MEHSSTYQDGRGIDSDWPIHFPTWTQLPFALWNDPKIEWFWEIRSRSVHRHHSVRTSIKHLSNCTMQNIHTICRISQVCSNLNVLWKVGKVWKCTRCNCFEKYSFSDPEIIFCEACAARSTDLYFMQLFYYKMFLFLVISKEMYLSKSIVFAYFAMLCIGIRTDVY